MSNVCDRFRISAFNNLILQPFNLPEFQNWLSKSPSESSLMGFKTTPGYGFVTSKAKSGSHGHVNPYPLPETNGGPGREEFTLKKVKILSMDLLNAFIW